MHSTGISADRLLNSQVFKACVALLVTCCLLGAQTAGAADDARVQELYREAKAAQAVGDTRTSIRKYEEIVRIAPRLAPAYNNLGLLYFESRNYRKAAAMFEQSLKINPALHSTAGLLGMALYASREYLAARPHLEAALRANGRDANTRLFLAKDLFQLGDYRAAALRLEQLSVEDPKNQEVWSLLGKTYMKLTETALGRMNAIDPHSAIALELSAEMMEAMDNYEGALVPLKKAVEIAPQRPGGHYKLGEAYRQLGELDPAAEQFQAELKVDPSNCMAESALGGIGLSKNEESQAALLHTERALSLCPELTETRVDHARALLKLARYDEAARDLESVLGADPNQVSAHFFLAKAYVALGRTRDSQSEMETFSRLEARARTATADLASRASDIKRPKP